MNRRKFLTYGAFCAAGIASPNFLAADALAANVRYELSIEPVDVEMIDGVAVYMLLFYGGQGQTTPRPLLRAREGDLVTIRVKNNAPEPHRFSIPGIGGATIAQIAPGAAREVTFTAPAAGTFMYLDPLNAPVNRLLGLHGGFIVSPANGLTSDFGKPTPYSASTHTAAIRSVFNALGSHPRFPGDTWRPDLPEREKVWIFSQTDPALNRKAERRETITAAATIASWLPRYFTINGLSGYDLEEVDIVCAKGYIGEPTLIRTMNAGQVTHSPHLHGNHLLELTGSRPTGAVTFSNNIYERDVWTLAPLERRDMLLPFEKPPDIPDAAWPPVEEPFPMRYVMHCHTEMSQTAGGGNYPQGLVTHWELLGLRRP